MQIELEERKCKNKKCKSKFKVMIKSQQEFCSDFCKYEHNPKSFPLNRYTKEAAKYSKIFATKFNRYGHKKYTENGSI
jgi:hypothetical protein